MNNDTRGAYHLAKKPGKSVWKLWTTSRGTPLFLFGTEFGKCPYHLPESFRFQALSRVFARFYMFFSIWRPYTNAVLAYLAYYGRFGESY